VRPKRPAARVWEDRGAGGRALRWLGAAEDAVLVLLLAAMVVLAVWQIVERNLFQTAVVWIDPLLRVLVLWVGLLGAVAAARDDRQINVDVVARFTREAWRSRIRVVTDLFTAAVTAFLAWHAVRFVMDARAYGEIAFGSVPLWAAGLILPAAFALLAVRYLLLAVFHASRIFRDEERP
jgi:TRAP-type C4-dicarboxylate transport system permease small subunit